MFTDTQKTESSQLAGVIFYSTWQSHTLKLEVDIDKQHLNVIRYMNLVISMSKTAFT